MEAYRDQYATLFNAGKKVVVIGISTDADTTQANWARDSGFPNLFASDPDQAIANAKAGEIQLTDDEIRAIRKVVNQTSL